ncbi:MAG TPA: 3-oxoacyl-ACP reductase FabG [Steroidobacteraceae bacterium]|jgi:3-oxoacyl-[acyl-carrier protein] reductase|nr:3-oxoacyl-ACP reductase FabG [Steroidobacteraceae bacterium]
MSARRALVTGGSGGIGSAICRQLAHAGHHVYVHAHRSLAATEALVQELQAGGAQAQLVHFDVTDAAATAAALETVLLTGPIQILVNNAAIHDDAAFPAMSIPQWQRVIDVSLQGFFHVTRALLLPMIRTRWGRVINISSVAALKGNRGQVNYAAAKGALNAATRALALEVATRGITVNAVAPGIITTRMTQENFDAAVIERLVPMQRAGSAEEVASLVGFLAADAAAYITGQVISINGGMY